MLPCTEEEAEAYFTLFLIYTSLSTLFGPSRSPFLTSRRYTVWEWHKRSLRVNTRLQRESAINTIHQIQQFRTHQLKVCTPDNQSESRRWCNECNKHFSTETALKRHVAMMHRGLYPYRCQYCGRGYASMDSLKGHLVQHTGIKAVVFHICGKEFSYSRTMKVHVKQFHADTAP